MAGHKYDDIDKLSEAVKYMLKCLECTICLQTITLPVKTRCGHSFCHTCISRVLNKRSAVCPLCKASLKRRSISRDEHLEMCITKFEKLSDAIYRDTNIDILSYSKRPNNTKESCSKSNIGEPGTSRLSTKEHRRSHDFTVHSTESSSKAQNTVYNDARTTRTSTPKKVDRTSNNATTTSKYGLSGVATLPYDEPNDERLDVPADKVKSWLINIPDDAPASDSTVNSPQDPLDPLEVTVFESVSQRRQSPPADKGEFDNRDPIDWERAGKEDNGAKRTSGGRERRSTGYVPRAENNAPAANKGKRTQRTSGTMRVDSADRDLKYNGVHMRVRTKSMASSKEAAAVPDRKDEAPATRTNAERSGEPSNSTTCRAMKENWSRVVQFGREMRPKKGKLKSLNVSIESKHSPKVADAAGQRESATSRSSETATADKNTRDRRVEDDALPNADITSKTVQRFPVDNRAQNSAQETTPRKDKLASFITFQEGEQVNIRSLDTNQMNDIIGVLNPETSGPRAASENLITMREDRSAGRKGASTPLSVRSESDRRNTSKTCLPDNKDDRTDAAGTPLTPTSLSKARCPLQETSQRTPDIFTASTAKSALRTPTQTDVLSLRKNGNNGEPMTSSSPIRNDGSRLSSTKRDLTSEFVLRSPDKSILSRNKNSDNVDEREDFVERRYVEILQKGRLSPAKNTADKQSRCSVIFKKLGKIVKERKKVCKFLYLGSTIRENVTNVGRGFPTVEQKEGNGTIDLDSGNTPVCNSRKSGSIARSESRNSSLATAIQTRDETTDDCARHTVTEENRALDRVNDTRETTTTKPAEVNEQVQEATFISPKRKEAHAEDKSPPKTPIRHVSANNNKEQECQQLVASARRKSIGSLETIYVSFNEDANEDGVHRLRNIFATETANNGKQRADILDSSKTTLVSAVRLLSPEKDSQLKFLSNDSPLSERGPLTGSRCSRNSTGDSTPTKSGRCELKGARTRALARHSRDFSRDDETVASPRSSSKRGRPCEDFPASKQRCRLDDDEESRAESRSRDESDRAAAKRASSRFDLSRKHCLGRTPDAMDLLAVQNVCLSSDGAEEGATQAFSDSKKRYRRIVRAPSSDSSDAPIADGREKGNAAKANSSTGSNQKRRRASSDSADEDDVNAIVKNWCCDLNATRKSFKRAKMVGERVPRPENSPVASIERKSRRSSNLANVSTSSCALKDTNTVDADVFECEDRLNEDIIDMVRQIRGAVPDDRSTTASIVSKPVENVDRGIMQDNFDEVMANVETADLVVDFRESDDVVPGTNEEIPKKTPQNDATTTATSQGEQEHLKSDNDKRPMDVVKEPNTVEAYGATSSSDKENDAVYGNRNQTMSANEKTLLADSSATGKGNAMHESENAPFADQIFGTERAASEDGTFSRSKRSLSPTSSLQIAAKEGKLSENGEEPKDSYGHDSLMNITQHMILLKEFEEDLFGKNRERTVAETSNDKDMAEESARTPPSDRNRRRGAQNVEADHSGGEDDIVESTPDTKVKNIVCNGRASASAANKADALDATPTSRRGRNSSMTSSPRTVTSTNSVSSRTPLSVAKICPLYQSTPKSTVTAGKRAIDRADDRQGEKRAVCFVWSGLAPDQIDRVKELARLVGAKYTGQFAPEVTHVVVNAARKTLKYLQGIAYRKWIVGYEWVVECIRERRLVDEEPYEAVDPTLEAGPRNSRLRQRGLFEDFAFFCVGPYEDVTVEQYRDLLLATGATVVETLEDLANERTKLKAIVMQSDIYDNKIIEWYRKTGAIPIVPEWVVECIGQYRLVSLYPYLRELLPQDVLALGYPEELVEDTCESDAST